MSPRRGGGEEERGGGGEAEIKESFDLGEIVEISLSLIISRFHGAGTGS